ncbi:IPT/TIG domain-containing protein [Ramlibacter monticola]|uniref:Tandem-95 repeat protein n=1 Tax=Ramlibacter monticola TaxID=1926872 RepID=A0A936Z085_9BURK|nr:Ig-like domain-containing protein [Ramlibacter monticola]MBL0392529.1 hypothetical protein [Ramlibacter monticola]
MKAQRTVIATAAALVLAATSPAHAVLERMGPIDHSPGVGGYPAWFQDRTGIALEFCDLKTQAELDGGWCVLIPPDGLFPETFPNAFFDEHFYFMADNTLSDPPNRFRARLVIALEAAFANGPAIDGDQMVFARTRLFIPSLPFDGDYRVITPFDDVTYHDQKAGDRIFETQDVGTACIATFECAMSGNLGPFLLPSAAAGGAEVPPMPDLIDAPTGTDPFFDALLAGGVAPTANPGTGRKYLADPARIGPITGSQLGNFTDSTGAARNHNTFRIEVRAPAPNHDGPVIYTSDGETNFAIGGRLMTGTLPGNLSGMRALYKADATGNVTDLDVFAKAAPTLPSRLPTQPQQPATTPVLNFYDQACGGALGVDANTGLPVVNLPPYTAPAATPHGMGRTGTDYWGQSSPGGLPPSHICIEDVTARNTAGQVVPAYYMKSVSDDVTVTAANYVGQQNGTLTVNAVSSDPTALLTLAGYGPSAPATPGVSAGQGAGLGLELAGGVGQVVGIEAPPSTVQIVSSRGGGAIQKVVTAHGKAVMVGIPAAVNDSATIFEDCSPAAATACAPGQGVTVDLLANDTVLLNGQLVNLRAFVAGNMGTVQVTAQAPRLGNILVSPDGFVTYLPGANANGTDNIAYTVSVDGQVSNQAVVAINITPVNDVPVAGNASVVGVVARENVMNLIASATDPDGNADVKNAVITSWPAQLGAQPTPVGGAISFTPSATGNFTFGYQVRDAAGLVSANTGTGTVTVIGSETIAYTKQIFKAAGNIGGATSTRWTVTGTDTVRGNQILTIAYADGQLKATGQSCNGSAAVAACVVGTAQVDAAGNWSFDQVGSPGGPKDPTDKNTWSVLPKNIRTFSSSPVLGGGQNTGISFK